MSLFTELKRRNVIRVAIAYLALAWLLIEVASTLFSGFGIPDWAFRFVVIILVLGFAPTLVFSWAYEITPEGVKREKDVVHEKSIAHLTAKRLDTVTIVLVVAAVALLLADRFWLAPRQTEQLPAPAAVVTETVQAAAPEPLEPEYPPNSIAVLPFVNMSDDAANEYFSDGISEELLNLLTKIPELHVISRSSAFSFKGKDVDIPTIASKLNVAHILEGSVRKAGNQVRITAQLIEVRSDTHLWSETYDRTLNDIFAIQDEIAIAVVDALKLTLLGDVPKTEETDPEAHALYLQAMYLGSQGTAEALEQSSAMLRQVLAIAPDFAQAWRGLARNFYNQFAAGLLPRDEAYSLSNEALDQALAIDPHLVEAHTALGWKAMDYDHDLVAAAQHYKYALSLEPTNPIVLQDSSNFLVKLGRLDEAIAIKEYLVTRDPLNVISHQSLAGVYSLVGRLDEAIASYRTALLLAPSSSRTHWHLGNALLRKGENEAALKAFQLEPIEVNRLLGLVMAYHALGQTAESDAELAASMEKYEREFASSIAMVLAYRGEVDRAFAWLDKTVQYNGGGLTWVHLAPEFADLHDDPRWLPFLESIGTSPEQLDAIEFSVTLPK